MLKKYCKGLTLIELLIAVLIFSIIASVLYSTFRTSTSVWRRVKRASSASMAMHATLDELAVDLRNAVAYDNSDNGLDFIGEHDNLSFCCLSGTVTEDASYTEIYRSGYLVASSKQAGKVDLIRKKAPLSAGGFRLDDLPEEVLMQGLDEVRIEYAYHDPDDEELTWLEAWEVPETEEQAGMPQMIRIILEEDEKVVTQYLWIPAGSMREPPAME